MPSLLKVHTLTVLAGALLGVLILFPVNEALFYYEHLRHLETAPSLFEFVNRELGSLLSFQRPFALAIYSGLGAFVAFVILIFYRKLATSLHSLEQLTEELAKDVRVDIEQGEGYHIEFKSSLRWDYRQEKVNKALDKPILKTIAGFMNGDGGTLLIGVDDNQKVLGLQPDYNNLKKPNRDGFELALNSMIAIALGTSNCQYVNILFHNLDGKDVCRVITKASPKPVYYKAQGSAMLFVRTGGSTRELNVEEAVDYVESHWG